MDKQTFIKKIAGYVQKYAPQYGIKVHSAIIAQAILESGWGESRLSAQYHNYFGLKCGTLWKGKSVNMKTQEEYQPGVHTTITDNFRVYDNMEEGVKGYFEFIQLARYQNLRGITDPRKYLETIRADGYATSSTYVENNMALVNQYNLTQYDGSGEVKETSGGSEATSKSLWTKTAELMAAETDYLEKASNANLDSKTANAGYGNYTKYARDVNSWGQMGCQGQPWCAVYQFWICVKIFGLQKALEIMGNGFYNCSSVTAHSKSKGTWHSSPKLGALVIFRGGAHIGRVTKVTDTHVYTNEGNTSAGGTNNVEANGGCVANKVYTRNYSGIDGYVWIDYGEGAEVGTPWKATGTATATVDNLYVRATPNGEVIGELMLGNRFEINGETSGKWTKVNVANIGVGWVWTAYTQKDGAQKADVIPNKQDKTKRLFVGRVTASELNVRTWAGTQYPQIKSYPILKRTNLVDVMNYTQKDSAGADWYYIRIRDQYYGFVHSAYIEQAGK